jgi:hypothetical protein
MPENFHPVAQHWHLFRRSGFVKWKDLIPSAYVFHLLPNVKFVLNHHLQSLPNVRLSTMLTGVGYVLFLLSCINVYRGRILWYRAFGDVKVMMCVGHDLGLVQDMDMKTLPTILGVRLVLGHRFITWYVLSSSQPAVQRSQGRTDSTWILHGSWINNKYIVQIYCWWLISSCMSSWVRLHLCPLFLVDDVMILPIATSDHLRNVFLVLSCSHSDWCLDS